MAYVSFPRLLVEFDDGRSVELQAKARDMIAAEASGIYMEPGQGQRSFYVMAFFAMKRMIRTGELPEDFVLPESVDDLLDIADTLPWVEENPADPEGNDSGQTVPTG